MTAIFPTHLFKFRSQRPRLVGRAIMGGQSISGVTQSVNTSGGGFWMLELGTPRIRTRNELLAWRALEVMIDDGVTHIIVPLCDYRQAPVPIVSGRRVYDGRATVPHSDDTPFSDDTEYVQGAPSATFVNAAVLRATSVRVQMVGSGSLIGGEHLSVTHTGAGRRLYRVRTVEADLGAGVYDVTIRPPLRQAVAAGDEADFRFPSFVAKVAEPGQMAASVENLKFAKSGGVTFVEAFD